MLRRPIRTIRSVSTHPELLENLLRDPHLDDIGFCNVGYSYPPEIKRMLPQPVVFAGVAAKADVPPRSLGADTRAVLNECGYSSAQIDDMASQQQIIAQSA